MRTYCKLFGPVPPPLLPPSHFLPFPISSRVARPWSRFWRAPSEESPASTADLVPCGVNCRPGEDVRIRGYDLQHSWGLPGGHRSGASLEPAHRRGLQQFMPVRVPGRHKDAPLRHRVRPLPPERWVPAWPMFLWNPYLIAYLIKSCVLNRYLDIILLQISLQIVLLSMDRFIANLRHLHQARNTQLLRKLFDYTDFLFLFSFLITFKTQRIPNSRPHSSSEMKFSTNLFLMPCPLGSTFPI